MTDSEDNNLFSVSASRLVRPWTRRKLTAVAPVAVIVVIAGAWGALYDIRYVFPALIMLFIIWVAINTWSWLTIIGDQDVAQLTRPQRWIYSGGRCTVELYRFPVPPSDESEQQDEIETPDPPELFRTISFSPGDVTNIQQIDTDIVLYMDTIKHPGLRYLVISQRNMPPLLEQDIFNCQQNLSS